MRHLQTARLTLSTCHCLTCIVSKQRRAIVLRDGIRTPRKRAALQPEGSVDRRQTFPGVRCDGCFPQTAGQRRDTGASFTACWQESIGPLKASESMSYLADYLSDIDRWSATQG